MEEAHWNKIQNNINIHTAGKKEQAFFQSKQGPFLRFPLVVQETFR